MSKQEATRLADALESITFVSGKSQTLDAAAALLRQWPDGEPVAVEYCWLVEHFLGDGTRNSTGHYHTAFSPVPFESRSTKDPYKAKRFSTRAEAEAVAAQLGSTLSGTWRAVEHGFHAPPGAAARIAELEAQRDALRIALEFAQRAVEDAIYTEDGLDGDAGQRTLHIFREALEHGTFDKVKYGELPPPMLEVQNAALVDENESLRAALKVAAARLRPRPALEAIEIARLVGASPMNDIPLVNAAIDAARSKT